MGRYDYYGFAPYESVGEKKEKAKKKIAQLRAAEGQAGLDAIITYLSSQR